MPSALSQKTPGVPGNGPSFTAGETWAPKSERITLTVGVELSEQQIAQQTETLFRMCDGKDAVHFLVTLEMLRPAADGLSAGQWRDKRLSAGPGQVDPHGIFPVGISALG